jgi:hypothetical protein
MTFVTMFNISSQIEQDLARHIPLPSPLSHKKLYPLAKRERERQEKKRMKIGFEMYANTCEVS